MAAVQYLLQLTDTSALYSATDSFARQLENLPQLKDVSSSLRLRNPQLLVDIDRDVAAWLGITPAKIQDTLQSAFGGRKVSLIYDSTDQYSVFLEVDRRLLKDINVLGSLYLSGASGEVVPLLAVARFRT
ncbi:efflux RND transporter permease subunit, partial [Herbaspirillum sp. HC18]